MATYEEAKEEYVQKMGPELGTRYHLLWNECAYLHRKWEEFTGLFGKDQEQFDVMNGAASGFFKSVQDAFWEGLLLHLCRFADPYDIKSRKTLSLDALLHCPGVTPVSESKRLVDEARTKMQFARDWRNRFVAHRDLDFARKAGPAGRH